MKKFFAKILLCTLTATVGCGFTIWHIDHVLNRGYDFRQIFNWGTWMNQNLLVILGITIFFEVLFLIIFRDKNKKLKKSEKAKVVKEKADGIKTIID